LFLLNRTYGYDVADQVIAGLAKRLRASCREMDLLARYAGNKFALVLDACDTEEMTSAATRFLEVASATPFDTEAGPIPVSLRIGGVVAPRNGRSVHVLFQHAEEALDLARQPGSPRFVAFEPSLAREDTRMRALKVADEIVSALNQGRIVLALQPLVHAATGKPALYESLMRLRRPDGTLVTPNAILPTAEKSGLIQLIDQRVMELSLKRLAADTNLHLAVNVSGQTVHDPDFPIRLRAALAFAPDVAERLTIEITETCAIEDVDATALAIASIKQCGAKVAMDDFGAGHTSFKNLRRLDFDLVKIDGAFVQNLARSPDDRFFVRTLIDLARHVGIPVVAEWVEDAETAKILREWGVEYLQGDFFAPAAVPEEEAEAIPHAVA
jgi:diguanylate cyclase (GGDEF)-like protein